ncbi:MAG: DUF2080 family transposase-associated protein [Nanoarchaeota archaeon]
MESLQSREQIIRKVTPIGNGAHIFAPRNWLNEEVILVRVPKMALKEEIINILKPHLEDIEGAFLYGSYARGEQEKGSDVDLLVIANKKITIKKVNFEIICLESSSLDKAIKISPILICSALAEAKPIINSGLLDNLRKKYAIKKESIKEYTEETNKIIIINDEFPDLYSIVLRLKGLFIINQLLSGRSYSHKEFKMWLKKRSPETDYEEIKHYKKKSESKKEKLDILLNLLKKSVQTLEKMNYGKKIKKT